MTRLIPPLPLHPVASARLSHMVVLRSRTAAAIECAIERPEAGEPELLRELRAEHTRVAVTVSELVSELGRISRG